MSNINKISYTKCIVQIYIIYTKYIIYNLYTYFICMNTCF